MADTLTPNYNFILPEVGASDNTWGNSLNANWTALDTTLSTFLPSTGGTMTGRITLSNDSPSMVFDELDTADANWKLNISSSTFLISPVADNGDNLPSSGRMRYLRDSTGLTDVEIVTQGDVATIPGANSVLNRRRADTRYLQLTGGELTGRLTISNDAASIVLNETDTADATWKHNITDAVYYLRPTLDDGVNTGTDSTVALYRDATDLTDVRVFVKADSATVPADDSIITARRGDARYQPKTAMQAGIATTDNSGVVDVTFDTPFATPPVVVMTTATSKTSLDRVSSVYYRIGQGSTTTGFTATSHWTSASANGTNADDPVHWIAMEATTT